MRRWVLGIIVVALACVTFLRIISGIHGPAARWDEQTNLAVIQHTKKLDTFPVLYHGYQPFFEKPPLWYMLNVALDADDIVELRGISVVSAVLIVALSVGFVWRRFGPTSGLITWGMLLLAHPLFVKNAGGLFSTHTLISADADSLLILFMLVVFIAGSSKQRGAYIICGIATAIAVLTKGPIGLAPLIALSMLRRGTLICWIVVLVFAAPWYLFMYAGFGQQFLQWHLVYHLGFRTITPLEGHDGPPWYYLQILANPFVYPGLLALIASLTALRFTRSIPFEVRFAGLTALLLLLIPSIAATKLAWYILPVYPFLALFCGMVLGLFTAKYLQSTR